MAIPLAFHGAQVQGKATFDFSSVSACGLVEGLNDFKCASHGAARLLEGILKWSNRLGQFGAVSKSQACIPVGFAMAVVGKRVRVLELARVGVVCGGQFEDAGNMRVYRGTFEYPFT